MIKSCTPYNVLVLIKAPLVWQKNPSPQRHLSLRDFFVQVGTAQYLAHTVPTAYLTCLSRKSM